MFDLIRQSLLNLHRQTGANIYSRQMPNVLLFDSSNAAMDIAFMLGAQWDGCNSVVVSSCDEVAINTAAKLLEASWCYAGTTEALSSKLNAGELMRRYGTGERMFINANLRCEDLSDRYLKDINLSFAKLRKANLSGANLSGADLSASEVKEANLSNANLSQASLARANLNKANLSLANLKRAFLNKADLRETNLTDADLSGANLCEADLRGATLINTNLSGADLRGTKLTQRY